MSELPPRHQEIGGKSLRSHAIKSRCPPLNLEALDRLAHMYHEMIHNRYLCLMIRYNGLSRLKDERRLRVPGVRHGKCHGGYGAIAPSPALFEPYSGANAPRGRRFATAPGVTGMEG